MEAHEFTDEIERLRAMLERGVNQGPPRYEPDRQVNFREDPRLRLRQATARERAVMQVMAEVEDDWLFVELDEAGEETDWVTIRDAQWVANVLSDQFEYPRPIGPHADPGWTWWAYQGRYFVVDTQINVRPVRDAIGDIEPNGREETMAFIAANLPEPMTQLEQAIETASEEGEGIDSIVSDIETELLIAEDDEKEETKASIRRALERAHERGHLSSVELSRCQAALGDAPTRRETIPEHVRHAVWRRDQGRCVQCGSQENLEYDHLIPFSRGGSNTERNLQLLCQSCNRAKGAHI